MTEGQNELNDELNENDIELEGVNLSFQLRVTDIESLGEALHVAAANLARYGLDSLHILAEEIGSERAWIAHQGRVIEAGVQDLETVADLDLTEGSDDGSDDEKDDDGGEPPATDA